MILFKGIGATTQGTKHLSYMLKPRSNPCTICFSKYRHELTVAPKPSIEVGVIPLGISYQALLGVSPNKTYKLKYNSQLFSLRNIFIALCKLHSTNKLLSSSEDGTNLA